MAMTLHRTKARGAVPCVRGLLSPYLGLSLAEAEKGRANGRWGLAIYAMIQRKHELANTDTGYEKAKAAIEVLLKDINKAVDAKSKAMLKGIDNPTDDDKAFTQGFIRNRNHKADYKEVDTLRATMQEIADAHDEAGLDAGEISLMGASTSKTTFPLPNSVYTIYNNYPRWKEVAFLTDSGGLVENVCVANGERWDKIECLTGVKTTSTRTMQQIHYTLATGGEEEVERLMSFVTANGFTTETYDPFRGITCGQGPQVKDVVRADAWKGVHKIA